MRKAKKQNNNDVAVSSSGREKQKKVVVVEEDEEEEGSNSSEATTTQPTSDRISEGYSSDEDESSEDEEDMIEEVHLSDEETDEDEAKEEYLREQQEQVKAKEKAEDQQLHHQRQQKRGGDGGGGSLFVQHIKRVMLEQQLQKQKQQSAEDALAPPINSTLNNRRRVSIPFVAADTKTTALANEAGEEDAQEEEQQSSFPGSPVLSSIFRTFSGPLYSAFNSEDPTAISSSSSSSSSACTFPHLPLHLKKQQQKKQTQRLLSQSCKGPTLRPGTTSWRAKALQSSLSSSSSTVRTGTKTKTNEETEDEEANGSSFSSASSNLNGSTKEEEATQETDETEDDSLSTSAPSSSSSSVPSSSRKLRSLMTVAGAAMWLQKQPAITKKRPTVIHPKSAFAFNWNLFMFAALTYMAVSVPYGSAFTDEFVGGRLSWQEVLVDIILVVDIWVNMHKTFMDQSGTYVGDHKRIRSNYIRSWFAVDLLSVLPVQYVYLFLGICLPSGLSSQVHLFLAILYRLLKLVKLLRFVSYLGVLENDRRFNQGLLRFFELNLVVFLIAHWIGCIWFLFGRIEGFGINDFVPPAEMERADTTMQVLTAFYWAFTTMTGAGKDLEPQNKIEMFFSIAVIFVGISTYATIIGNVGSLISNFDSSSVIYRQKMDDIATYMRYRKLPQKLQERITNYYEYLWTRKKGLDEEGIFSDLPESLRTEVAMFLNMDILKKVPFFTSCGPDFTSMLVTMLKPRVSVPGEYLIRQDSLGNEMYFLSSGYVEVRINGELVKILGAGSFFGEYSLLFREKRTANVKTLTYCDLFVLTAKDFNRVLKEFPEFESLIRTTALKRRNADRARRARMKEQNELEVKQKTKKQLEQQLKLVKEGKKPVNLNASSGS
ncbi:Cyclic nucleotide-binding domain-containing protein [Balamuthia mandrillaris]